MDKLFYFILSITFLFIFLPIFYSLTNPGNLSYLFHAEVLEAFKVTILAGILATFISLLLSLPSAYILARKEFKFKKFVEGILDLPMAIPHVVVGIMLLSFIYGIDPLKELVGPYIVDNFFGIVLVYLFVGLPFMLNSLKDGILAVDEELEHVSRTLGASKVKTFFTIILPLIRNNIITGSILCFARGISEVGALLVIAYYPKTVPILILENFNNFGLQASKPLAVAMIILSLIIFIILRRFR